MAVDTTVEVTLPAMGESVTEGVVLGWVVKEGDHVGIDDPLVEVSTDKVDAEVPSPASGTVARILVSEGDTIAVGAVLCEISPNRGGGSSAVADEEPEAGAEAPPPAAERVIDVAIPAMGESVTE